MDGRSNRANSLHKDFREAFTDPLLEMMAAIVAWGHMHAPKSAFENYGEVGIARSGLLRWIEIDSNLYKLNGKFPGIQSVFVKSGATGMKHVEVLSRDFGVLVAHDPDDEVLLPKTDYAKDLTLSNQKCLFPDGIADAVDEKKRYYALLFHAKSEIAGEIPASLEIRFPDGCGGYAAEHLRLYNQFPHLKNPTWLIQKSQEFSSSNRPEEEKIKEQALPTFRQQPGTGVA